VGAVAFGLFSESIAAPGSEKTETRELSLNQAQEDFDLMRSVLEEAHAGLTRYTTKSEMDRVFTRQRAKLAGPLKNREFMTIVSETLSAIRCGHTSCEPDPEMQEILQTARFFPLRVHVEDDQLIVLENGSATDSTIRPGMEILKINGHGSSEILRRVRGIQSADGDIQSSGTIGAPYQFGKWLWRLYGPSEEFKIELKDSQGHVAKAILSGVSQADQKNNHNPVNAEIQGALEKINWSRENQALRFLNVPDIAEIRLKYFVGDDLPKWLAETFKTLREKKTKALIIDLRNNGGGEDMYGALLISYLTEQPFKYFERIELKTITPSFKRYSDWGSNVEKNWITSTIPNPAGGFLGTTNLHQGLAVQKPADHPFLGKVFVLTDGGTFSTAADFCAVLHHLKRATFVGEETGGGYYGNNSGFEPRLKLPNSKLQVRVPMYEYWNAVSAPDWKRHGTIPDVPVESRVADWLIAKDLPLETALNLAKQSLSGQ
jgi:hypothetical protein